MAEHLDFGSKGEEMAAQFLEQKGYRILERNWVYQHLEIDIIAYTGQTLVFIEVKTRSSSDFGMPEDFVLRLKQQRIARAAEFYRQQIDHQEEVRFDIIAILFSGNASQINHIEDAFWPQ